MAEIDSMWLGGTGGSDSSFIPPRADPRPSPQISLSGTNSATSGIVPGSGGLLEKARCVIAPAGREFTFSFIVSGTVLAAHLLRFTGEPLRTEVDLPRHGRSEPHSRIQRQRSRSPRRARRFSQRLAPRRRPDGRPLRRTGAFVRRQ